MQNNLKENKGEDPEERVRGDAQGNARQGADREVFAGQLKKMLDWYTFHASDEEYDEKTVEYILNLLDNLDPIEETQIPRRDAEWERFRQLAARRMPDLAGEADVPESHAPLKRHGKPAYFGRFAARHRYIVAAVVILLLLAIGNTAHVVATHGSGFFFWLRSDEKGRQMITSPDHLGGASSKTEYAYADRDKAPEWVREWFSLVDQITVPEGYEGKAFKINEFDNWKSIEAYYESSDIEKEILFGAWRYFGKISLNTEGFHNYSYIYSYQVKRKQLDVYSKTEDDGKICYIICFFEENCQYYVGGWESLDDLKQLIEQYWYCVEENL